MEKTCFKCGALKSLSEFYVHKQMADGHLNKCIVCTKKDEKERFYKKLKDPKWREKELERHRIKAARFRKEGRLASKNASVKGKKKWAKANKHKRFAQSCVAKAINSGIIRREPCEICGSKQQIHAHHDDYSKPLDVIWLCPKHHGERHVEINKAKRLSNLNTPLAEGNIGQFII
jgi:hypothetical protein